MSFYVLKKINKMLVLASILILLVARMMSRIML